MARTTRCPCGSGQDYNACCGVFHRGEREAPDAVTLMRSRYAAFAMREVEYLWRTFHPDHPDRAWPRERLLASLRASVQERRYMGLTVLDHRGPDAGGIAQVLFLARVFEKGRDRSFVECSDFARDENGWRYLGGRGMLSSSLPLPPESLTIARFDAL